MFGSDKMEMGGFGRAIMALSQYAKMNLTVFSQESQTRNIVSGMIKLAGTGNFKAFAYLPQAARIASQSLPENIIRKDSRLKDFFTRAIPSTLNIPYTVFRSIENTVGKNQFGNKGDAALLDAYKEVSELGLVDNGIEMGSIRQYADFENNLQSVGGNPNAAKVMAKNAADMYQLPDSVAKIAQYLAEKERNLTNGMSLEQAKLDAAEKTRMTQPTYGDAPKWLRNISAFPAFGNFILYKAEAYRTTWNAIGIGVKEIKEGNSFGYVRIGATLATATTIGAAEKYISQLLTGIGDDEEEAFRRLQKDYGKNGEYIFTKLDKEKKEIFFAEMSFTNPIADPFKVGRAALRGETTSEKVFGSVKELSTGMTDVDIFLSNVLGVYGNKTSDGKQIVNEQKDFWTRMGWTGDFLAKTMIPKVFDEWGNLAVAAFVSQDDDPYKLTVGNELAGKFFGVKIKGRQLQNQYEGEMRKLFNEWEEAKNIYEYPNYARHSVSKLILSGAYQNKEQRKEALRKDAQKSMDIIFAKLKKTHNSGKTFQLTDDKLMSKKTAGVMNQLKQGYIDNYGLKDD
jgi:hypothetical protein